MISMRTREIDVGKTDDHASPFSPPPTIAGKSLSVRPWMFRFESTTAPARSFSDTDHWFSTWPTSSPGFSTPTEKVYSIEATMVAFEIVRISSESLDPGVEHCGSFGKPTRKVSL